MTSGWNPPQRLLDAGAWIGASAAVVVTVAALVLTRIYQPSGSEGSGHSDAWLQLHASASAILGMGAFATLLVLIWPVGAKRRRRPVAVLLAGLATLAAAAAIATRDLLAWDTIGFASVRVVGRVSGYWLASFDTDIQFLLVEGVEVTQASYARLLIVHLASPPVAGVLVVAAVVLHARSQGGSST